MNGKIYAKNMMQEMVGDSIYTKSLILMIDASYYIHTLIYIYSIHIIYLHTRTHTHIYVYLHNMYAV